MTNLKKAREAAGMSQTELSKASGVNIQMIQHYEQGVRDINKAAVATVWRLSEALGVDIKDLIEIG